MIGVYVPPATSPDITAMERWLGSGFDLHHVFTNWDPADAAIRELFEDTVPAIHAAGRTPLLTWEPFTPTPTETSAHVVRHIERGDYDQYLDRWGSALAAWLEGGGGDPRRVAVRLAHEMNGSWYPWGAGTDEVTPESYAAMWRRVFDRLAAAGVDLTRIDRVWSVNHVDVGGATAEACYPGADYVDWVTVDGYNWGAAAEWSSWRGPRAVFDEMVDRLGQLTEAPIGVTEFGSTSVTESGPDPARKAEWLEDAFDYFASVGLDMVVGFNVDKETDWAVFGGERGTTTVTVDGQSVHAYPAFAEGMARFAGEDPPGST